MYSYSIAGSILIVVASGASTLEHRESVLGTIRADPRVPAGASLLIDGRKAESVGGVVALQERAHLFVQMLGPKMGPFCAVIVPPALEAEAALFQAASGELGVRVGLFCDQNSAIQWLRTFAGRQSNG